MPPNFLLYGFDAYLLNGVFAHSWENRKCMFYFHDEGQPYSRCRFIVHIADLSALVLIHEFSQRTTKHRFNWQVSHLYLKDFGA